VHVQELSLDRRADKTILSRIMKMAFRSRNTVFVFFTRDTKFFKHSGFNTMEDVPDNLEIIILQKYVHKLRAIGVKNKEQIGASHRGELIQIVLFLFKEELIFLSA